MATKELKSNFSNPQLELLKFCANGIPDDQLIEIKWLLGKYFAEKATIAMDNFLEKKGISSQDILTKSQEHHRRASRS